jgi:uncharacterized protein YfeS
MDSLNLNVGMDALLKLQEAWGEKSKQLEVTEQPRPINEVYSRDEFLKKETRLIEPEDEDSMQSS